MALKAQFYKHTLNFSFDAGTSRGVLKKKDSYFIKIYEDSNPDVFGLGESGPLEGISLDFGSLSETKLIDIVKEINEGNFADFQSDDLNMFPSVRFALETAFRDFENGGQRKLFENAFFKESLRIPINGLVWMGNKEFMKSQIVEKLEAGFDTIKLKIGAIDFNEELDLLAYIRKNFSEKEISIRVDANGAFGPNEALEKLKRLSDFNLHSIEQPIKPNQHDEMAYLCENSPLPIALDEELIQNFGEKYRLLEQIKPQYLILKPSLMGGISGSKEWISTANSLNIKWWITSALESNIGLNAISQFTAEFDNNLPQGLGTGKLYTNNFESPLKISNGQIFYDHKTNWALSFFK